jgi:hypothetical protein
MILRTLPLDWHVHQGYKGAHALVLYNWYHTLCPTQGARRTGHCSGAIARTHLSVNASLHSPLLVRHRFLLQIEMGSLCHLTFPSSFFSHRKRETSVRFVVTCSKSTVFE